MHPDNPPNNSNSFALGFQNTITNTDTKDTIQTIYNDPYRADRSGFLTGGFDGYLRYYTIQNQTLINHFAIYLQHPIISCTLNQDIAFAGLCNGSIIAINLLDKNIMQMGNHGGLICKLFWSQNPQLLISIGFNQILKTWNLSNFQWQQYKIPYKPLTAAFDHPYILIGCLGGKGYIVNIQHHQQQPFAGKQLNFAQFSAKMTSSCINASKQMYGIGTCDGKFIMGSFLVQYPNKIQLNSVKKCLKTQKSIKQVENMTMNCYGQVNEVQFGLVNQQIYAIIAGSEEIMFYNLIKNQKPRRIPAMGTSGKVSINQKYFIYSVGYDWSQGIYGLKQYSRPILSVVAYTPQEMQSLIQN